MKRGLYEQMVDWYLEEVKEFLVKKDKTNVT